MKRLLMPSAAALALLAACEPARVMQPAAPAPVTALAPEHEAMLERLLQAHAGGREVDAETRKTFRHLLAVALSHQSAPGTSAAPPAPSPEVVRALRELQASPRDTESMQRILLQLVAEQQARRNTADSARP